MILGKDRHLFESDIEYQGWRLFNKMYEQDFAGDFDILMSEVTDSSQDENVTTTDVKFNEENTCNNVKQ